MKCRVMSVSGPRTRGQLAKLRKTRKVGLGTRHIYCVPRKILGPRDLLVEKGVTKVKTEVEVKSEVGGDQEVPELLGEEEEAALEVVVLEKIEVDADEWEEVKEEPKEEVEEVIPPEVIVRQKEKVHLQLLSHRISWLEEAYQILEKESEELLHQREETLWENQVLKAEKRELLARLEALIPPQQPVTPDSSGHPKDSPEGSATPPQEPSIFVEITPETLAVCCDPSTLELTPPSPEIFEKSDEATPTPPPSEDLPTDTTEEPPTPPPPAKLLLRPCSVRLERLSPSKYPQLQKFPESHHLQECRTCGRTFQRFRLHKCKVCPWCGKTFRRDLHLKLHVLRKHTRDGDMPFHCSFCGKGFVAKAAVEYHVAAKHDPSKRKWICDPCGKSFASPAALYLHKANKHMV